MTSRPTALDRLRVPAALALLALIVAGGALWFGRQPRAPVRVVYPAVAAATVPPTATASAPKRVNVNTASRAELEALPGIGPVIAQRIIDYRAQRGAIRRVDELLEARLMPRSTLDRLRDRLSAEPPTR